MGRPPKPILSIDRIADAALDIIEETGSFQVIQIAKRLHVAPSSLYNHVSGKEEVVEHIRSRLNASVAKAPTPGDDWRVNIRQFLLFLVEVYAEHRRAMVLLFEQAISNPDILATYEDLSGALLRSGFRAEDLTIILSYLDASAMGLAMDSSVPNDPWDLTSADTAEFPLLRAAQAAQHEHTVGRALRVRALGVDGIIATLEQYLATK